MIFNSLEYISFLIVVSLLYFLIPYRRRWVLLLVASYFFYASWNASYLVLILLSTGIDYLIGLNMRTDDTPRRRKLLVVTSLFANLGLLFTFKYWNFFSENLAQLAEALGSTWEVPELSILLPVGISFYTFQTLSYTLDLYRGVIQPERHLGRFAVYVAFFPQLVAGPIERAKHLLPQFEVAKRFDYSNFVEGVQLITIGLAKKVVIADRLAIYVDAVYSNVAVHSGWSYLLATYAFAFQIYCDFSGYSDIAIGSAKILGFDLMKNFNRPYFATSITDFWRRWHISLSTWLRDYLYISLGGNRRGPRRTHANLLITMILGGLWHGASWNFVIWGTLHGLLLVASKTTMNARDTFYARLGMPDVVRDTIRRIITFHLVCLIWVFFRAESLPDSLTIIQGMLIPSGDLFVAKNILAFGFVGWVSLITLQALDSRYGSIRTRLSTLHPAVQFCAWCLFALSIPLMGVTDGSQFIYFQF
jgi:alginate O-acetyltransferase complex protein AlgI